MFYLFQPEYGKGNYPRRSASPWRRNSRPNHRMCSVALVIASCIVLVVVLGIGGLALYMGELHSNVPSPFVAFNCSIKVLRGDRFVGALQEKVQRYNYQLENLYKKSVLGPGLVSSNVERFGDDTYTIYFKLVFNKNLLPRNNVAIKKTIRDILLTDAISKTPVFKNVRFVPRSVQVQEVKSATSDFYNISNESQNKNNIIMSPNRKNLSVPASLAPKTKQNNSKKSPSVYGSFKISKTDADITQKTEVTTVRIRNKDTLTPRKTTPKISVTSSYKIGAVEKVSKSSLSTTTTPYPVSTSKTTFSTPITSTTQKNTPSSSFSNPFNLGNLNMYDGEPWIPIISVLQRNATQTPSSNYFNDNSPVYTSFTNPSLSFFNTKTESLGGNKLKGHPIPVNKIIDITESGLAFDRSTEKTSFLKKTVTEVADESLIYTPRNPISQDYIIRNISSIFHNLAASLEPIKSNKSNSNKFEKDVNYKDSVDTDNEEYNFGEGQVEVVDSEEEILIKQTTKLPLVTLLPIKSNIGIGKPLRRRPAKLNLTSNDPQEERSFAELPSIFNSNFEIPKAQKKIPDGLKLPEDFKIVSILNFASEIENPNSNETSTEAYRKAKMENEKFLQSEDVIHSSTPNSRHLSNNFLSPDKVKLLSEISVVRENKSTKSDEIISTKAIPSYTINHAGFKILTKTFNKLPTRNKESNNSLGLTINITECGNHSFECADGTCLSQNKRCNHLKDCKDGSDEDKCKCVEYLKAQFHTRKICDGIIDCWDSSDENDCEWCQPHQYVCANSKKCIDKHKICDGIKDCIQGDDERRCVTVAKNTQEAEEFSYHTEGYLMVRQSGDWGKLCVENLTNITLNSRTSWQISDLGKTVCKSMTYENLTVIKNIYEQNTTYKNHKYFELTDSDKKTSSLSFKESKCIEKKIAKIKCKSLECGLRPQVVRHRARIVGGGNAVVGAWPWQVALYKEGEFQCGGTLVSDRWLLSAGHCFFKSQNDYWVARLGALRRGTTLPSPYEQLRPIIRIIIHPAYEDTGFLNDISLLQMETAVTFSDYVRPICLPSPNNPPENERQCTVLGWGQLSEVGRIFPDTLQEVQIPIISTAECRKRTLFLPLYKITEDMFCAGYERGGRDACLGDSGGPLLCSEKNGRWTIYGITSNGYGCARANRPGVYTKVSSYVKWIETCLNLKDDKPELRTNRSHCSGHRCSLGQCLPKSQLCNGHMECNDGSDERNC